MLKNVKNKLMAVLMAAMTFVMALPMNAMAEEVREERSRANGEGFFVSSQFHATADDLADMNLNAMISFPITLYLERSGSVLTGEGDIYMFGVLGEKKKMKIAINDSDTANRNVIKHRKAIDGGTQFTVIDPKYYTSCVTSVSGDAVDGFTNLDGVDNLLAKNSSQTIPHTMQFSCRIEGFIPIMGEGVYLTGTPLIVSITDDED